MKRLKHTVSVLLLAVVGATAIAHATARLEGKAAPDFALKSRAGDNLRLSEHRGEVVMINFWASWCGPCRQEIPELNALYERYRDTGFTLIGVNIDDNAGKAERLAGSLKVAYPVLFDREKAVSRLYEVDAMPSTVLIDRDGVVRQVFRGYRPGYEHDYQQAVRGLLRE